MYHDNTSDYPILCPLPLLDLQARSKPQYAFLPTLLAQARTCSFPPVLLRFILLATGAGGVEHHRLQLRVPELSSHMLAPVHHQSSATRDVGESPIVLSPQLFCSAQSYGLVHMQLVSISWKLSAN